MPKIPFKAPQDGGGMVSRRRSPTRTLEASSDRSCAWVPRCHGRRTSLCAHDTAASPHGVVGGVLHTVHGRKATDSLLKKRSLRLGTLVLARNREERVLEADHKSHDFELINGEISGF